jgi:hypothetical protein
MLCPVGNSSEGGLSGFRLDADSIIDRRRDSLGAAEITFRGLHRNVSKQELNLLQLPASGPAQAGATSAEVVRRELGYADLGGKFLDDVPDESLRHAFTPNLGSAAHAAEEATAVDSGSFHPVIQQVMHPIRNGYGPNVSSLPAQVNDCSMPFALLKMPDGQAGEFVAAQTAGDQHSEQRPIYLSLDPLVIGCLPKRLTLVGG